jgi:hypothetical protein
MSIDRGNSIFKKINKKEIPNLIGWIQFNKRIRIFFLEVRVKLASYFENLKITLLLIVCQYEYGIFFVITELKFVYKIRNWSFKRVLCYSE